MRRKILDRDDAPHLTVILDEAVLRRPVGAPAVMREQYGHLADVANLPRVTIRVLPFKAGPHQAMGAGFHIFEFAGESRGLSSWNCSTGCTSWPNPGKWRTTPPPSSERPSSALDAERSGALLEELVPSG